MNEEERHKFFIEFDEDTTYLDNCIKRYFSLYNEGFGATKKRNDLIISTAMQIGKMNNVLKKWKAEYHSIISGNPPKKIIIKNIWGGDDIYFEENKQDAILKIDEPFNPF